MSITISILEIFEEITNKIYDNSYRTRKRNEVEYFNEYCYDMRHDMKPRCKVILPKNITYLDGIYFHRIKDYYPQLRHIVVDIRKKKEWDYFRYYHCLRSIDIILPENIDSILEDASIFMKKYTRINKITLIGTTKSDVTPKKVHDIVKKVKCSNFNITVYRTENWSSL